MLYLYEFKEATEEFDKIIIALFKKDEIFKVNIKEMGELKTRKNSTNFIPILEFKPSPTSLLSDNLEKYQNKVLEMALSLLSTHTKVLSSYIDLVKTLDIDQHI